MNGFTHESTKNETKEWYTPKWIFDFLGNPYFDLDPASPGKDVVPWINAAVHYTLSDDGLSKKWDGCVWLNPPYGQDTPKWLNRLKEHGNGIALVFARTDTKWFHSIACKADVLCFLRGRIAFLRGDGQQGTTPGCGSLLLAWGNLCGDILVKSNLGWCVDNRPRMYRNGG